LTKKNLAAVAYGAAKKSSEYKIRPKAFLPGKNKPGSERIFL
jgi:hypothetical protein